MDDNGEKKPSIDERLEAIIQSLELASENIHAMQEDMKRHDQQIGSLVVVTDQNAENIRALVRIAEIHERRLTDLEGGQQ